MTTAGAVPQRSPFLDAVLTHIDNVLNLGRDVYGPRPTPLFVDGIDVDTHRPATWRETPDSPEWVMVNLASQQNLFRTLDALTTITGQGRYRAAAEGAMAYGFEHLQADNGLMHWGGHRLYDAATGRCEGERVKHELKSTCPYYEFLWRLSPDRTRRFIEAFWDGCVRRWDILDFDRHAYYDHSTSADIWGRSYTGGPVPFEGEGLTFSNAGADLYYSAVMLHRLSGGADQRPLEWARRLARRYVEARDPTTGLGADNYSGRPDHRMEKQFPQFNGRFSEATVTSLYGSRYHHAAYCQMRLAEDLGEAGREFLQWAVEDLEAYAKWAWDPADRGFLMTLIDGTRLGPEDRKLDGYVGRWSLSKRAAEPYVLLSYALAWRLTGRESMRRMAMELAGALGLLDHREPVATVHRGRGHGYGHGAAWTILSLLEMHRASGEQALLERARVAGQRAVAHCLQKGFLAPSPMHRFSKFDTQLPLALLELHRALVEPALPLPRHYGGGGSFQCPYMGRRHFDYVVYEQQRQE